MSSASNDEEESKPLKKGNTMNHGHLPILPPPMPVPAKIELKMEKTSAGKQVSSSGKKFSYLHFEDVTRTLIKRALFEKAGCC